MEEIVHLRIKKEYASALIEDLIKARALETVEDIDIPEWQKKSVRETLERVEQNPSHLKSWETIKQKYKRP